MQVLDFFDAWFDFESWRDFTLDIDDPFDREFASSGNKANRACNRIRSPQVMRATFPKKSSQPHLFVACSHCEFVLKCMYLAWEDVIVR